MEGTKHQYNGNNIVSPPPEVWDNIVKRIKTERNKRVAKLTVVVLILMLTISLGTYRLIEKGGIPSGSISTAEVQRTGHRDYVEIAKELDRINRKYPNNPILKFRQRAIRSKLNEYTTLTSAGVWRW